MMKGDLLIAYFSMEIALEPGMPTYCGGLGFLAGDLLRSAADQELAIGGVSLLHRKGYFRQHLDELGSQTEEPCEWTVEDFLKELAPRVKVSIEGRTVWVRAWQYDVKGGRGGTRAGLSARYRSAGELGVGPPTSPIIFTAGIRGTGCARRSCWASAACACCGRSGTGRSSAFT